MPPYQIQVFNYSIDIEQSLLWRFNEATNLISLVKLKQAWYDVNQSQFWENWFNNVFNLQTADQFGLYVWSIILDMPIIIGGTPNPPGKPLFGFNAVNPSPPPDYINTYVNFGNGNFSNSGSVINLTTAQQRMILKLRYYQLVMNGNVIQATGFLRFVFSSPDLDYAGDVYMLDGLDMSVTVVFTKPLPSIFKIIFETFDILPRGAGVKLKIRILNIGKIFGFGPTNQNFTNGNFVEEF